jgi:D-alanyl-D-alanine carboxypeptidase
MRLLTGGRAVQLTLAATLVLSLPGAAVGSTDASVSSSVSSQSATFDLVRSALVPSLATGEMILATEVAAKLPACGVMDKLTRFDKVRHWKKTLLDTNLKVKRSYKPWDLASVSRANIKGSGAVRKIVLADLNAMAKAARKAGKPLAVRSAYRSYATQVATFNSWVRRSGYKQALKFSARPGHSEHQLGTTIDFTAGPGRPLSSSFGNSAQGKWMARHAWKYGFINPYPKGKRKVSCYGYEPWHWRYVGREQAKAMQESGQVARRWLWQNYESAP